MNLSDFAAEKSVPLKRVTSPEIFGINYHDHPMVWWWRADSSYWWTNSNEARITVHFQRWFLVKTTPKMVVLNPYKHDPTWDFQTRLNKYVLKDARKRYAHPTKSLAWQSWCIRQRHRLHHAKNALEVAQATNDFIAEYSDQLTFE